MSADHEVLGITQSVAEWVERVVVGLNLCPFAKVPLRAGTIKYAVTTADTVEALLDQLIMEVLFLDEHPQTETTLLIHPWVLQEFSEYNEFLAVVDRLLQEMDLEGVYQIASFHPNYQFAGTLPEDAQNYSNRSPYPMLHLLREESVAAAVDSHPDAAQIPLKNIEVLTRLGSEMLADLLSACQGPQGR